MKKIILTVVALLLVGCDAPEKLEMVHVEVYFSEKYIDPIKTDANVLYIHEDRIEIMKIYLDANGNIRRKSLVLKRSEYDSISIKKITGR